MFYKSVLHRWLALALTIILFVTSAPGALAMSGETNDSAMLMMSESQQADAQVGKVDAALFEQFASQKYLTYIVKLKEQVNVEAASTLAAKYSAFSGETSAKRKQTVRSFVLNSLMETADRAQSPLLDELEAGKRSGTVQDFRAYYIVNAVAVTSTQDVMERLSTRSDVEAVTPNHTYTLDTLESPEEEVQPRSLHTMNDMNAMNGTEGKPNVPWNLRNINAPQVWEMGIDGTGIVVANMDSGVDWTHPTLQHKWRGYNAQGELDKPELHWYDATLEQKKLPHDGNGHGTHVMGTMVGSEVDGKNPIGVASQAKWIAVRIFDSAGSATDAGILAAGEWLMAPTDKNGRSYPELAPDIVNNSWGNVQAGKNEFFQDIVKAWRSAGIFPAFSAGNTKPPENNGGPGSITPPGNYPESFATGAVDIDNRLASFSLQGPTPYGQMKPEVSAPGVNIRSSMPNGKYGLMNGTSMASPHTAGVAALLLQANHSLTVEKLESILKNTAVPLTDDEFPQTPNNGFGWGIVNALNAVSSLKSGLGSVEGTITIDGSDDGKPVIEHTPITLTFNAMELDIYARAMDDNSVVTVELMVRAVGGKEWTTLPMTRISGNHQDGKYEGNIPVTLLVKEGIEYRIRAVDFSGNEVETDIYPVKVSEGVKLGYKQDFEQNIEGFDFGGELGIWEWGEPTTGPGKAYSGSKLMATRLHGNYPEGVKETFFVLPLIDLRDGEHTILSFKHWHKLGDWFFALFDKAEVFIGRKSNGFQYELVKDFRMNSRGWQTEYIDLSPYKGDQIYVLFNLRGENGSDEGWYVDDIELIGPNQAQPATPIAKVRSNTPGRVIIEWDKEPQGDVMDYVVYRSTTPGGGYEEIGTSKNRSYGDLPTLQQGTYYYIVKARTYSQVLSEASNEVSWTFTGGTPIFSDDFEGLDKGWTLEGENNQWEHGEPNPKYGPKEAVSGSKVWGTNLSGSYAKNTDQSLISPEIDLTGAQHASIYFQQWYDIDGDLDKGTVEISSDDGATWRGLASYPKPSYDSKHPRMFWYLDELGIDDYAGKKVKIRFRLKSGNSTTGKGWFIDNFEVRDTPPVKTVSSSMNASEDASTGDEQHMPEKTDMKASSEKKNMADPSNQPQPDMTNELRAKDMTGAPPAEPNRPTKTDAQHGPVDREGATTPSLLISAWKAARQEAQTQGTGQSRLPAAATVTIVETDRSAKTDLGSGRYKLQHPPGDYQMRVEAYGYRTVNQGVTIADKQPTEVDIHLQPLLKGTIMGTVTDEATGRPVAGASVRVMEDAHVPSVMTDVNGNYTIEAYEGDYRLLVSSLGYLSSEQQVSVIGEQSVTKDIALKSFMGTADELAYDSGKGDNAIAYYSPGNGYAVRMTTKGQAQVTGARMFFWDEGWPEPGGTEFQYAMYDAEGPDGLPGAMISGPHTGTAQLDGTWTKVDFPNTPVVNGDFYVAYIQPGSYPDVPGLAVDQTGANHKRSWKLENGSWKQAAESQGNYMIRARITKIGDDSSATEIRVEPRDIALFEGQQTQLTVKARNAAGYERDVTQLASYHIEADQAAAVDSNGMITALGEGEAVVTVTYNGLQDTVRVTVEKAPDIPDGEVRSISVHPSSLTLTEGKSAQLSVTAVVYANGEKKTVPLVQGLTFVSSDSDIAAVNHMGWVTGHQAGNTTITAQYGELQDAVHVTVEKSAEPPQEEVRSITVRPSALALTIGESAPLSVTASVYANGEKKTVPVTEGLKFSSSDPEVAKVDDTGRVSAHQAGEARIHVEYGALQATAQVTVKKPDTPTPPAPRPDTSGSAPSASSSGAGTVSVPDNGTPIVANGKTIGSLKVERKEGVKNARAIIAQAWLDDELAKAKTGASNTLTLDLSSVAFEDYGAVSIELALSLAKQLSASGKAVKMNGTRFGLTIPADALPDFMSQSGLQLTIAVNPDMIGQSDSIVKGEKASIVSDIVTIGTERKTLNKPLSFTMQLDDKVVRDKRKAGIYYRNDTKERNKWEFAGLASRSEQQSSNSELLITIQQLGSYSALEYGKTFADISNHWGRKEIEVLASQHVAVGRNEYQFAPNDQVTRAEFMTLLDRILGKEADWAKRASEPGAHDILRREGMIVMLVTALDVELPREQENDGWDVQDTVSLEARAAVAYAYRNGLVKGIGNNRFAGDAPTSRAQVAVILHRVLEMLHRI
ncbi:S8 family serine peptidase [Paenibacillus profundus]|uniref:S8 family serine peptidase n=1 Tax=Paenibacillus profundus TaxID=1173085 RepID=A0ABS8YJV9_9BACL|nr:S8 family serine peptidase [Paenibacillus profundus]MCE5170640.1 S8 family serine peptidase [Paenibacillus profundus]